MNGLFVENMDLFFKLCILIQAQVIFTKQNYRLVHDHAVADSFNKEYYSNFTIANVKLNRTMRTFYIRFDIHKEVPNINMLVQPYWFLSNEYKTWNAGQASFDYCKMLNMNLFGTWVQLQRFSNLTKCPHKTGIYYLSNLLPEDKYLPANLPTGKYKVEFKFTTYADDVLFQFSWYGYIESTKPLRRKN